MKNTTEQADGANKLSFSASVIPAETNVSASSDGVQTLYNNTRKPIELAVRKLTKQTAIKRLQSLGVHSIAPSGKFLIHATYQGYTGLFDPRDFLIEILLENHRIAVANREVL